MRTRRCTAPGPDGAAARVERQRLEGVRRQASACRTRHDADDEDEGGLDPRRSLIDHIAAAAKKLHVDRAVLDEIKELLDDKGQVVLYGPPGTGKTYLAVELAMALADGDEERVSVVQFHPATTYEDFFEGLRPSVTDAGQVTYKRTSGPLVAIAEKAAKHEAEDRTYVLVIDEINRANLPKVFGELLFLLENRRQVRPDALPARGAVPAAGQPEAHRDDEHGRPVHRADRRRDAPPVPLRPVLPARGDDEGPAAALARRRQRPYGRRGLP